MTKHVIDGPKKTDTARLAERFTQIEGDSLPRPQTLSIQKRPRQSASGQRFSHFLKIDKRRKAWAKENYLEGG